MMEVNKMKTGNQPSCQETFQVTGWKMGMFKLALFHLISVKKKKQFSKGKIPYQKNLDFFFLIVQ